MERGVREREGVRQSINGNVSSRSQVFPPFTSHLYASQGGKGGVGAKSVMGTPFDIRFPV